MAAWIAGRVGEPGSYCGLPAPTGKDRHAKLRLFTGEVVGSHAGTGCKLGFEATWALTVLAPTAAAVARTAQTCREIAVQRFAQETARRQGMYCCHSCSNAGWRALAICPPRQAGRYLDAGLAILSGLRDGKGRWEKFPFWYTVLALSDMEHDAALAELRYAAPALQRALRAKPKPDPVTRRRALLAERVLERV